MVYEHGWKKTIMKKNVQNSFKYVYTRFQKSQGEKNWNCYIYTGDYNHQNQIRFMNTGGMHGFRAIVDSEFWPLCHPVKTKARTIWYIHTTYTYTKHKWWYYSKCVPVCATYGTGMVWYCGHRQNQEVSITQHREKQQNKIDRLLYKYRSPHKKKRVHRFYQIYTVRVLFNSNFPIVSISTFPSFVLIFVTSVLAHEYCM